MSIRLIAGDCRDVLPTLAADSVQCCITSPPYYALRSYLDASHPDKHREIGSEPTPDAYLATMVAVFREVRRVLRPDGTCWVNMGDSYWNGGGEKRDGGHGFVDGGKAKLEAAKGALLQAKCSAVGLKPKDLLLMPARLALALQADGWWVRSAIVWAKPNPMPESCRDRPTSAYEMVYLLTKSARYFYDADAVREEAEYGASIPRDGAPRGPFQVEAGGGGFINGSRAPGNGGTRNLRNVWTIATAPFSDFHYATFPPSLAERCIRAGTSERGCCAACGKPWGRITERVNGNAGASWHDHTADEARGQRGGASAYHGAERKAYEANGVTTTGWHPGCTCDLQDGNKAFPDAPVPCRVLDPFAGAGTTLLVADRLQRDAIGIELNTAYTQMAMDRCIADAPLFTSFSPAEDPESERMRDLFAEAAE